MGGFDTHRRVIRQENRIKRNTHLSYSLLTRQYHELSQREMTGEESPLQQFGVGITEGDHVVIRVTGVILRCSITGAVSGGRNDGEGGSVAVGGPLRSCGGRPPRSGSRLTPMPSTRTCTRPTVCRPALSSSFWL